MNCDMGKIVLRCHCETIKFTLFISSELVYDVH